MADLSIPMIRKEALECAIDELRFLIPWPVKCHMNATVELDKYRRISQEARPTWHLPSQGSRSDRLLNCEKGLRNCGALS